MALDPEVERAVKEAAIAFDQSDQLASRLIAWLKDMSERELSAEEDNQHLHNARKAARIGKEQSSP